MMLYFAQLGVLIQFRVNHNRWIKAQTTFFYLDILLIYSRTLTRFYISFILRVRYLIATTRIHVVFAVLFKFINPIEV